MFFDLLKPQCFFFSKRSCISAHFSIHRCKDLGEGRGLHLLVYLVMPDASHSLSGISPTPFSHTPTPSSSSGYHVFFRL